MDILYSIFRFICLLFEGILYFLIGFFFLNEAVYTYFFKIAFLLILGFLIYTSFRPAKQKWIALYTGNAVFGIGSVALICIGYIHERVGVYFYGLIAAFYTCVLLFFIKFRHKKTPAPTKETPDA